VFTIQPDLKVEQILNCNLEVKLEFPFPLIEGWEELLIRWNLQLGAVDLDSVSYFPLKFPLVKF
jgi:hypothetical protein